jgi:predicted house-cleaning noncanonical NTP pyrophosphatase (MazG superfamily)
MSEIELAFTLWQKDWADYEKSPTRENCEKCKDSDREFAAFIGRNMKSILTAESRIAELEAKAREALAQIEKEGEMSERPVCTELVATLARFVNDVNKAIMEAMEDKDKSFYVNWGNLSCVDGSITFHMPGQIIDNKPVLIGYIEEGDCPLFNRWVREKVQPKWLDYHVEIKSEW